MHIDTILAIIANDLENLRLRIEAGPAHPKLTDAGNAVSQAKSLITEARADIHGAEMATRYGGRS